MKPIQFHLSAAVFAGLILLFAGCGDGLPTLRDLNDTNIRRLHSCYKIYMNGNSLTGPESKEELLEYLNTDLTAKVLLKRMDLNPDEISNVFVSERDGQPFKIRWGLKGIQDHAIVFESEGIDGKRMVAFSRPRELDAAEYDGFWSGELKGAMPGQRDNQPQTAAPEKSNQ